MSRGRRPLQYHETRSAEMLDKALRHDLCHDLVGIVPRQLAAIVLDLETLVCTRGPNFPLSRLESRLMCPACGDRRVTVVFEPPSNAQVGSG
jgi:hypothetical protein